MKSIIYSLILISVLAGHYYVVNNIDGQIKNDLSLIHKCMKNKNTIKQYVTCNVSDDVNERKLLNIQ